MNKFIECLATGFYIGKISKAPGTFGTIAAVPIWFMMSKLGPIFYMAMTFALVIVGIFVSEAYERQLNTHDSKTIVIDEIVGFLITMVWLPSTWQSVLFGFLLFRFFDIVKPPPIKQLDQKIQGGVGVVLDDVAAGIISNVILQFIYAETLWLGVQYQNL